MKINNIDVRVSYRVHDGAGRLHVTRDGKIWYGEKNAERFSHVANVGDQGTGKDAVCRAANCW